MITWEHPGSTDWSFSRSVTGVELLVQCAEAHQVSADHLLRGTALSTADIAEPQRRVTADQELRVIRNLRAALPDLAGSEVGRSYRVSAFGFLGFALLSSATLLEAMNIALRYLDLSHAFVQPRARTEGDEVVVEVDADSVPADVRDFVRDRDLAAMGTLISEVLNEPVPVRYDTDSLRFPLAYLDHALPQAHPQIKEVCEATCAELVGSRRRTAEIVEDVRVLITQQLSEGAPMPRVAASLGVSERTLRRQLGDAGTSYRAVLDELRAGLARELLGSGGLTVEEVAARLGYAEASSLLHAYRRWFGASPGRTSDDLRDRWLYS
ncbi:MAG: AraC family transcriptional regulator [Marmoricola sp.]